MDRFLEKTVLRIYIPFFLLSTLKLFSLQPYKFEQSVNKKFIKDEYVCMARSTAFTRQQNFRVSKFILDMAKSSLKVQFLTLTLFPSSLSLYSVIFFIPLISSKSSWGGGKSVI